MKKKIFDHDKEKHKEEMFYPRNYCLFRVTEEEYIFLCYNCTAKNCSQDQRLK